MQTVNRNAARNGTPRKDREDTRDLLINAAKKLFSQKGFDGISVKELADYAGVNVSLVSYHFKGKEGLYKTCIEQFGKSKREAAERLLQPPKSSEELRIRLRMFMDEIISSYVDEPDLSRLVHREIEMAETSSLVIFRKHFVKVFETLVGFVKSGQKNGVVRKDIDATSTARAFFGILMHMIKSDKHAKEFFGGTIMEEKFRNKILDDMLNIFTGGILVNGYMAGIKVEARIEE